MIRALQAVVARSTPRVSILAALTLCAPFPAAAQAVIDGVTG